MNVSSPSPASTARVDDGPPQSTVRVGVYGASGSVGTELVGIIARHARARLVFATSRTHAGRSLRHIDPAAPDVTLHDPEDVNPLATDLSFVCLPHGHSAARVEKLVSAGVRVVDLSGDLRLRDEPTHERVYGSAREHRLAARAVYGLTELERERIARADVVANPGCYPTCSALALVPLIRRGFVQGTIVIDAKSGVSGAGREATPLTHFCAVTDDIRPYALGRAHRHVAEIEQTLADAGAGDPPGPVVFCPHVVPLERGMLATIVVSAPGISATDVQDAFVEDYGDAAFIEVLPMGEPARIRAVTRTNRAAVSVSDVEGTDQLVLTSAIDNLLKGAAGQAVQNLNVMMGLPETTGLEDAVTRSRLHAEGKGAAI